MKIGRLRHRVTLQRHSNEVDTSGQPVDQSNDDNWTTVVRNIPAKVSDPAGSEGLRGQQVDAIRDTTVTMRFRTDVEADMRLVYGTRKLYVRSAVDPDGLGRELVCVVGEQR